MTRDEIRKRRHEIDREWRQESEARWREFLARHAAELAALKEACGKIGHQWQFRDLGPDGAVWSNCSVCGVSDRVL
jgi:hypothetical protein